MPSYEHLELHLCQGAFGPWNDKIRKVGGDPGDHRSSSNKRFVKIPTTPEGIVLAAELVREFGFSKTCVIFRPALGTYKRNEKATKVWHCAKNLGTEVLQAFVDQRQAVVQEIRAAHDALIAQAKQEEADRLKATRVELMTALASVPAQMTVNELMRWIQNGQDENMQSRLNSLKGVLKWVQEHVKGEKCALNCSCHDCDDTTPEPGEEG